LGILLVAGEVVSMNNVIRHVVTCERGESSVELIGINPRKR